MAPDTAFTCKPDAVAPAQPWKKLTTTQYRNTLRDLLAFAAGSGEAGGLMSGLGPVLARLPADERQKLPEDLHGSYRRLDQAVEQNYVDVTYDAALAVGAALTTGARFAAAAGACVADGNPANDGDCLTAFIQRFGERALRRPPTADEVAFYRALYGPAAGSDPAGYADVIAGFLTAPQFLYQVEHGDTRVEGKADTFRVGAYELASRLSYQFWETMPDEALLAAARSGALLTADGYTREVDRLFQDPRTRATIDEFYRDWLKLEDLAPLDARNGDPIFKSFAGLDLPRNTLRAQMIDDVLAMLRHYTWTTAGTFDDLFASELSFARAPELARLYGVDPWDGAGAPPPFPAKQRPGLLTRAAFLASGSANTRPVMKGVFTRQTILCDAIPPPPDNAAATAPDLDPRLSTRQVVERITEMSGTACHACHATVINPLGFATEGFDALGRVRSEQRLFDDAGKEIGKVPVDTRVTPQVVSGDQAMASGPADLMRLIAASGKAHACFTRHWFRFTFSRWEDLQADGCLLERLRKLLVKHAHLSEVLREIALAPEFQQRSFR